jgi:hypothetical protein
LGAIVPLTLQYVGVAAVAKTVTAVMDAIPGIVFPASVVHAFSAVTLTGGAGVLPPSPPQALSNTAQAATTPRENVLFNGITPCGRSSA